MAGIEKQNAASAAPTTASRPANEPFGYCLNMSTIRGQNLPLEKEIEIAAKAGLAQGMDETTARRRIAPFHSEVLAAVYGGIVERCRASSCVPMLVFLPQVTDGPWQEETPENLDS